MKEAAKALLETVNIRTSEEAENWINGELSLHIFG